MGLATDFELLIDPSSKSNMMPPSSGPLDVGTQSTHKVSSLIFMGIFRTYCCFEKRKKNIKHLEQRLQGTGFK